MTLCSCRRKVGSFPCTLHNRAGVLLPWQFFCLAAVLNPTCSLRRLLPIEKEGGSIGQTCGNQLGCLHTVPSPCAAAAAMASAPPSAAALAAPGAARSMGFPPGAGRTGRSWLPHFFFNTLPAWYNQPNHKVRLCIGMGIILQEFTRFPH